MILIGGIAALTCLAFTDASVNIATEGCTFGTVIFAVAGQVVKQTVAKTIDDVNKRGNDSVYHP